MTTKELVQTVCAVGIGVAVGALIAFRKPTQKQTNSDDNIVPVTLYSVPKELPKRPSKQPESDYYDKIKDFVMDPTLSFLCFPNLAPKDRFMIHEIAESLQNGSL
eukprot:TRINITY_DN3359_c0_g1_i6.p1 TRINITY_DN3359_c0_g1~~TRINITY_DN3359_c0_g1_i6.p1  ORF type:complete len:105 (-),score=11.57 TRINITY_DN3359_c0_g1_i6:81-395(-)